MPFNITWRFGRTFSAQLSPLLPLLSQVPAVRQGSGSTGWPVTLCGSTGAAPAAATATSPSCRAAGTTTRARPRPGRAAVTWATSSVATSIMSWWLRSQQGAVKLNSAPRDCTQVKDKLDATLMTRGKVLKFRYISDQIYNME